VIRNSEPRLVGETEGPLGSIGGGRASASHVRYIIFRSLRRSGPHYCETAATALEHIRPHTLIWNWWAVCARSAFQRVDIWREELSNNYIYYRYNCVYARCSWCILTSANIFIAVLYHRCYFTTRNRFFWDRHVSCTHRRLAAYATSLQPQLYYWTLQYYNNYNIR